MQAEQTLSKILDFLNLRDIFVDLEIINAEDMCELNKRTRNVDGVTDVLSFPNLDIKAGEHININNYPLEIEDGKLFLGSIALCGEQVQKQADEYGNGIEREEAYLIAHGVLHLLGYDHMNEAEQKVMRDKEEEIMRHLNLARK